MSGPVLPDVSPALAPPLANVPRPHSISNKTLTAIGIGASSGGLEAYSKLVEYLPTGVHMAYILVQHLDPNHPSLLVDLLQRHTSMKVMQAAHQMQIEADHLYIIPPGFYLTLADEHLHLAESPARTGVRLPFDTLLKSMAHDFGRRTGCIVLSGSGSDGSLGLAEISAAGGLVLAQEPTEAGYDGMPKSAIATGLVDQILPLAQIPPALLQFSRDLAENVPIHSKAMPAYPSDDLADIIELLRSQTAHDFRLYKRGTLQRRIERRMLLAGMGSGDMALYCKFIHNDHAELELLARDLLINVTSFFRDKKVFAHIREKIIPQMLVKISDRPLRIWVAGCSTGEEAYSLAILFREAMAEIKTNIKLQIFASDVDADAVASAREGFYPDAIAGDVPADLLAQYFSKESSGYRVTPEVRSSIVFAVHDILADPPFARLDMVSCRNLLIYLGPEAQAKVISLFQFALRNSGILLLGSAETVGAMDGSFETISKPDRLYRQIGKSYSGDFDFPVSNSKNQRLPVRSSRGQPQSRQSSLADICRRLVMEAYAPAAVLINRKNICLFSKGPTERYLRIAPGYPTHDLFSMTPPSFQAKLRAAVQHAEQENSYSLVTGCRNNLNSLHPSFSIALQPVVSDGEKFLLICFIDEPKPQKDTQDTVVRSETPHSVALEQELEETRLELRNAIRNLEISGEEQRVLNEEALSVNEEYQSTNEELLTSKEELQSLNEELTALNSQLQETLERQRTTSDDLQNVLYSTNVATLFLDIDLNIRFFTPATKSLFRILPGDVGRPLADLSALTADASLLDDARSVLNGAAFLEHEVETKDGIWFLRRISPYRKQGVGSVEGVVITFTNVTERKAIADDLKTAKAQAQLANAAKSRFLAAASHDLRQPMQTLALLHGLMATKVEGVKERQLLARFDETLSAMSGMLNTLLDINQIEAGTVRAQPEIFPVNSVLNRLRDEYAYSAQAQGLKLKVISCGSMISSDPRLLEQMLRNLLSNAFKYTKTGGILLGCRRSGMMLRIEIWDTGIGIPENELQAIFEEYHQLDNNARERGRGLGLGLAIVNSLAKLLGHAVGVESHPGKGSVFRIEVPLATVETRPPPAPPQVEPEESKSTNITGTLLVIEDEPDVRELLELFLKDEGHRVILAKDGLSALRLFENNAMRPDLMLADYNLPHDLDGLRTTTMLREKFHAQVPVIILTGDISIATLRAISDENCVRLNKPIKLSKLSQTIQELLSAQSDAASPVKTAQGLPADTVIFVVDDDKNIRDTIQDLLEHEGHTVRGFESCEAFLAAYKAQPDSCLLIDAYLPGMSGLDLLRHIKETQMALPSIMMTGSTDIQTAVLAMKAGALDFIEKPFSRGELLSALERALEKSRDSTKLTTWRADAAQHLASLTSRQHEIMAMVLAGHPSKNIAADLGISQRTVESHRAAIMKKTGSKSLPALARLAVAASD